MRDLEHLTFEKKLRDMELFSLEKTEDRSYRYLQTSKGQVSRERGQVLLSGAQQQYKELQAQSGTQGVPYEHEERLFYFEDDRALKQTVQRDGGILLSGDTKNPPGHFPLKPTVEKLVWKWCWTR